MNKYNILLILTLVSCLTYGQVKQEKEYGVDAEVFPETALELISPYLTDAKRIKYYKEIDGVDSSYEIKFNINDINTPVSSGIYFVQLRQNNSVVTKKILLAK